MADKVISVVIVSYRVKLFLAQTLCSVREALNGIPHEVFVVDNNSQDDSIKYLSTKFPEVKFIENKVNLGFGRANNQAIKLSTGEFTLILNPDTIISHSAVKRAFEWFANHPECGAVGTKMIDGNGNFLPESKRSFPTPWVSFCKIFGLSKLFPKSPLFAKYHCRYLDSSFPHEIDILSGAYIIAKTSILKALGGFDESFFMYGEDIDLSYRIVKEGYKNYYLPATIIHYKGESTKKDTLRYVRIFYEAMYIFFCKHYPNYSTPYYILIKAGILVRASGSVLKRAVKRLLPQKRINNQDKKYLILSDTPSTIMKFIDGNNWDVMTDKIESLDDSTQCTDIILDSNFYSYKEIIQFIRNNAMKNRNFHIYNGVCDAILTP